MIGFFDSGKGGLTLLAKAFCKGYRGTAIYWGDKENSPYGNKSIDELGKIIDRNVAILKRYGCKEVFCACNTASLAAKGKSYDIPLHTLQPEKYVDENEESLFFGTSFTVRNVEKTSLCRYIALPLLSTLIEIGNEEKISNYLLENLKDCKKGLSVILACTHYELVKPIFVDLLLPKRVISVGDTIDDFGQTEGEERKILLNNYEEYRPTIETLLPDNSVKIEPLNDHITF